MSRTTAIAQIPYAAACRRRLRIRGLRAALGCVLLLCTAPALAIDYVVELVLFENLGAQAPGGGGLWIPRPVAAVTLGDERAAAQGILPSDAPLALTDSAAAMTASGRYLVLQHVVWQQPGLAKGDAVRLRIALGQRLELFVAEDNPGGGDFLAATAAPLPGRTELMRTFTVAGTLELSLGRFLHLDSKLVYTDAEAGRSYRLDESRKMRSRELHYIDNPRFGILTRIVPAEDADEPLEPELEPELDAALDGATDNAVDANAEPVTEDGGEADDTVQN